ncbi:hypothetical protein [Bacteriophage sp.]|nr:hypothetical protein [Bacteriophage sp.]
MDEFIKMMIGAIIGMLVFSYVSDCHAGTKCESDGRGGICCWDTNEEGSFKPINCQ